VNSINNMMVINCIKASGAETINSPTNENNDSFSCASIISLYLVCISACCSSSNYENQLFFYLLGFAVTRLNVGVYHSIQFIYFSDTCIGSSSNNLAHFVTGSCNCRMSKVIGTIKQLKSIIAPSTCGI